MKLTKKRAQAFVDALELLRDDLRQIRDDFKKIDGEQHADTEDFLSVAEDRLYDAQCLLEDFL